jgi:hypothetical protein
VSLIESEEMIQIAVNEVGTLASREALKQFDTDGSALEIGGEQMKEHCHTLKQEGKNIGKMVVKLD